jgi:hypothetical protein
MRASASLPSTFWILSGVQTKNLPSSPSLSTSCARGSPSRSRHRQRPDGSPRAAGERGQGSLRATAPPPLGDVAPVLEYPSASRVAFSCSDSGWALASYGQRADVPQWRATLLQGGTGRKWHSERGQRAHAPAPLCHPSAGGWSESAPSVKTMRLSTGWSSSRTCFCQCPTFC